MSSLFLAATTLINTLTYLLTTYKQQKGRNSSSVEHKLLVAENDVSCCRYVTPCEFSE